MRRISVGMKDFSFQLKPSPLARAFLYSSDECCGDVQGNWHEPCQIKYCLLHLKMRGQLDRPEFATFRTEAKQTTDETIESFGAAVTGNGRCLAHGGHIDRVKIQYHALKCAR